MSEKDLSEDSELAKNSDPDESVGTSAADSAEKSTDKMEELAKLQQQLKDLDQGSKKPETVQHILDSIKNLCSQLSEYGEEFVFIAKNKDENKVQIVSAKGKHTIESNMDIVGQILNKESSENAPTSRRGRGRPRKHDSGTPAKITIKDNEPQNSASGKRPGRPRKYARQMEEKEEDKGNSEDEQQQGTDEKNDDENETPASGKRRRGRPRKSESLGSAFSSQNKDNADNNNAMDEDRVNVSDERISSPPTTNDAGFFSTPSRTSSRKRKPSAKLREIMSDAKERQRLGFSFDVLVKTEPLDEDEIAENVKEDETQTDDIDDENYNLNEDAISRPRGRPRKSSSHVNNDESPELTEVSDSDDGSDYSPDKKSRRGRKRKRMSGEGVSTFDVKIGDNVVMIENQLKFDCKICKMDLQNVKSLQKHILVEHNTQCTRCFEKFETAEECRTHIENCSKRSSYECKQCGKVCTNEGAFSIHVKSHEPICRFCKMEFPDMETLKSHRVQCSQMRYIFNKLETLKNGKPKWKPKPSTKKQKSGNFVCDLCNNGYHTEKQLLRHKRRHDDKYRCAKCKEVFPNRHTMLIHQQACTNNINLNNTILTCEKCGKTLNNMGALVLHQKSHKTECSYCNEDFLEEEKYREHKKVCTLRLEALEQQRKKISGFKCCVCARVFYNMGSKRKHEISHTRDYRFIAEMCGISLKEVRKVVAVQVLTFRKKHKGMTAEEAEENFFAEKPVLELNDSSVLEEVEKLEDESMLNLEKDGIVLLEDEVEQLIKEPEYHVVDEDAEADSSQNVAEDENSEKLEDKVEEGAVSREDVAMQNIAKEEANQIAVDNEPVDIRDYKITDLKCKMCQHEMTSIEDLFEHIKVHRKFACHLCCKMLSGPKALEVHIKQVHIGERKAMCTDCGKGFKTEYYLKKHIDIMHRNAKPSRRGRKRLEGPFFCDMCDKVFHEKKKLTAHSYTHHPDPQQCPKCDKILQTTASLRHHLRSVHIIGRPFQCPDCERCYKTISNLREHISLQHAEKPLQARFRCEQCNKAFYKKAHLLLHEKTHTNEKPLPCHHCGKRFLQRGNLNKHIAVHHLKEKPHQCPLCDKAFTIKELWSLHMRIHVVMENRVEEVGDKYGKIYKCEYCENRYFPRKSGYELHMRCHKGDRPYKCPICQRAFYQSAKVYRHLHTHFAKDQFTNKQIQQMFRPQVLKMDMRDPAQKTKIVRINIRGEITEEDQIEFEQEPGEEFDLEALIKQSKVKNDRHVQTPIIRVVEGPSATKRAVEAGQSLLASQALMDSTQIIVENASLDESNIIMEEITSTETEIQTDTVSSVAASEAAGEPVTVNSQAFVNVINKLMSGEDNSESVILEQEAEEKMQDIRLVQIGDEYYVTDEHGNIRTDYQVHVQQPEEQQMEGESSMILIQE